MGGSAVNVGEITGGVASVDEQEARNRNERRAMVL